MFVFRSHPPMVSGKGKQLKMDQDSVCDTGVLCFRKPPQQSLHMIIAMMHAFS